MYSNNPFLEDPSDSSARFPDISLQTTTSQYSSWIGPQPTGFVTQTYPQYQQTQYTVQTAQPTGYNNNIQIQPTGAYGQHHISGSSYGYLSGQTTTQQTPAYRPAQQQLLSNPGYVAQFDPYASIGQGWEGTTPANRSPQLVSPTTAVGSFGVPTSQQTPTTSRSASGLLHPREFVRTHKAEIERWDNHAWKQLLTGFESLKDAWSARKLELETKVGQLQQQMQYADYYQAQQIQQEGSRLQGVCICLVLVVSSFAYTELCSCGRRLKRTLVRGQLGVLAECLNVDYRLGRCVYIPNAGSLFWVSTFSRSGKQAAGSRGYERCAQGNFRLASAVLLTWCQYRAFQGFLWVVNVYIRHYLLLLTRIGCMYVCMYKYNVSIMMCIYSVQVSLDANGSCVS